MWTCLLEKFFEGLPERGLRWGAEDARRLKKPANSARLYGPPLHPCRSHRYRHDPGASMSGPKVIDFQDQRLHPSRQTGFTADYLRARQIPPARVAELSRVRTVEAI